MKSILQYILKILSKLVLWKYQPEIIAVTGSVGKTSTKEAIYQVLRKKYRVRRNIKNYNNEIGVPLTILGLEAGGHSIGAWIKNFSKALLTFLWKKDYPEILILEMGIDRPGDMKYLLNFVPVKIGVITAIGEFPTHIEFFPEKDELIGEKALLVKSLPKKGLAVLNYDDVSVRMIGDELEETKIIYYGFGRGADIGIHNYDVRIDNLEKRDFGINFKLEYQGSIVPIKLNKVLGKQKCFAVAVAAAVGAYFGLNLIEVSSSLAKYRSLSGRTNLLNGIKKTWIIDDTYNASPASTLAALDVVADIAKSEWWSGQGIGKKIIVLGDMLELGKYMEEGHRVVGEKVAGIADLLFTVGDRARFIADEAKKQGFPEDKIFDFSTANEAALEVQEKLNINDIILIKGSQAMYMEEIVKEIMAEPQKAKKLLVSR